MDLQSSLSTLKSQNRISSRAINSKTPGIKKYWRGYVASTTSKRQQKDMTPATSSKSTLMTMSILGRYKSWVIDYEGVAKIQENFLIHYTWCYIFRLQTKYKVHINNMIVAEDKKKDAFLIWTCERVIELDMINFLTNLRDINAKRTICLIPCDEDGNLLLQQPITWNEIKDGKFLIINGQHNISASRSLQETLVCAAKRQELQT